MGRMIQALLEPIPSEKKRLLSRRWQGLDDALRQPGQGYGRQSTGCGATIGVMPRCDFDCHGCYLGGDANQVPRRPLPDILEQIDRLRAHLGPKGNLQLTDGEVTLLPPDELVTMVRHARHVGLIPMLMTHGDTFRRRPELLPRLVSEGGLTEVSIHIDSLQRGRRGAYAEARSEEELMPLRQEMADMVLRVRRQTGVRLRAATTLTLTAKNLPEVPAVVRWVFAHRHAFGLISFQPLAQVGRTRAGLQGVSQEALWRAVEEALAPVGFDGSERTPLQFGHPDCTRMEPFLVYRRRGGEAQVVPIVRPGSKEDTALVKEYFERGLGGANFRDDPPSVRIARGAGMFLKAPGWFSGPARHWASRRARGLGTSLWRLAWDGLRRRVEMSSFVVVSHHFMDASQMASSQGQERLAACVFRVPVEGEMRPMCQVNAGGLRDRVYAAAAGG